MRFSPIMPVISSRRAAAAGAGVGRSPTLSPLGTSSDRGARATALPRYTRRAGALALTAAVALLSACNPEVQGNGVILEQPRTTAAFVGLHVQDRVAVYATAGETQSVKVVGDANIVPNIETVVEQETVGTTTIAVLQVRVSLPYTATIPPKVVVTVPALSYVNAEDASRVEVLRATASEFRVKASGASQVVLNGPGGALLDVTLVAGGLRADSYPVEGAYVVLTGNSLAVLNSSGPVTGTAAETSKVDNLEGLGPCVVTTTDSATTACH
jgi:hypothetical protein